MVTVTKEKHGPATRKPFANLKIELEAAPEAKAKVKHSRKNGNKKDKSSSGIPQLELVEVVPLSDTEIAQAVRDAAEKKKWAEQTGQQYFLFQQERDRIYAVEGWEFDSTLMQRVRGIEESISQIEGIDPALFGHVKFSAFLAEIRIVQTREEMSGVIHILTTEPAIGDMPRYREASGDEINRYKSEYGGKLPEAVFCSENVFYVPNLDPATGKLTGGQKALGKELNRKLRELSLKKKKGIQKKMEELMATPDASDDLCGILNHKVGMYKISLEPVIMNNKKVVRHGGVAIVEVFEKRKDFFFLRLIDGAGAFGSIAESAGRWDVTIASSVFGSISPKVRSIYLGDMQNFVRLTNKVLSPLTRK